MREIKKISDAAVATGESPKVFYALDNTLWTAGPGSFVDELLKLVNADQRRLHARQPTAPPPKRTTSSRRSSSSRPTPT